MIRFVGLDVHKRVVQACILDRKGKVLSELRLACFREDLLRFARKHLKKGDQVALEATTNCWAVARLLTPFVAKVVVSNPLTTKAIASAKVKTDKIDAKVLAELLRCNFLPIVWQPDEKTEELRSLTRHRASLGQERTMIKNRVHAIFHQRLIQTPECGLFTKQGRLWMEMVELDPCAKQELLSELRLLDSLGTEIDVADKMVMVRAYEDPRIKLLMTIPGIDYGVASTLIAAFGDIKRFKSADHAASYLGLVPSTFKSADSCHHGRITKQGNSQARWMLTQAAQVIARDPGPLGVFCRNLIGRRKWNIAITATARKLAMLVWHMLKNNEPYRYAKPQAVMKKLSNLRSTVTGKRRKPEATPPTDASSETPKEKAPKGYRFETVPSIAEVLEREGLPAPKPLAPGEQRILQKLEMVEMIGNFHARQRKLRKSGAR